MSTWYVFSLHELRVLTSSRNKFCFTGGYIEANVSLPGVNNIVGKVVSTTKQCSAEMNTTKGFWPAIWTLGNLGRAGYGASLEGMVRYHLLRPPVLCSISAQWPYTYDACDVGTVANQSINGQPVAATEGGDAGNGGVLSYLPGQRLSRCTCPGESHPGPKHSDGTFVGRAAPEIDVFEAQVGNHFIDIPCGVEIFDILDYGNSSDGPGITIRSMGG